MCLFIHKQNDVMEQKTRGRKCNCSVRNNNGHRFTMYNARQFTSL